MGCKKLIISQELWGIENEMFARSLRISRYEFIKSKKFSKEFMMKKNRGFTLIELLVVISIIALLLSILMPGLQRAKELASGVVCTNNQKSLCTAWVMYAEDNDSKLVGGSTYYTGNRATPYRWVEPPLLEPVYESQTASEAQLSERTRLNGIRAGKLFTYLESEKVYHCPGDKTYRNPEPWAVYRSYAIAGLMNGEDFKKRSGSHSDNQFNPITEYRTVNLDGRQKLLKVATKTTDVRSPGSKFVFVEEDVVKGKDEGRKQQYNKGGWVLLSNGYTWWDGPAGYHAEGSTLGYADGHAERIKWKDKDTIAMVEDATPDPDEQNNEDIRWLAKGYIPMP
jgi:prepilin-type N-terminal cleavage/methylation domain-containing protein/prepilin-type processing-associated H-X9-DG protein